MGCFVPGGKLCSVDGFKHLPATVMLAELAVSRYESFVPRADLPTPTPPLSSNRADMVRQEHFLKEIEAIRRRLLALEDNKAESKTIGVTPDIITPVQFRSIAVEESAAKAEEVSGS